MSRPGFLFCICPDWEICRQFIEKKLDQDSRTWKRKLFWADEELGDDFWEALISKGLFQDYRAVIIRRAENLTTSSWNKFHPVLSSFRPYVWPFFCIEKDWSRNKPQIPAVLQKQKFWKLAQQKNWIWQSSGLNRDSLPDYLLDWAKKRDLHFSKPAFDLALNMFSFDASALKNELAKLELQVQGRKEIGPKDLEIITYQTDMDVFAFLTALQSKGKEIQVWRKIFRNEAGANAEMVFQFLGLLLREARTLWQLLFGEQNKVYLPPKVMTDKANLARKMGAWQLMELWTQALEAEANIKSGDYSPDQALEILTSNLMELFRCVY